MFQIKPPPTTVTHDIVEVYKASPLLGALLILNLALLGATSWYLVKKDDDIGEYIRSTRKDMQELRMKAIDLATNCSYGRRR